MFPGTGTQRKERERERQDRCPKKAELSAGRFWKVLTAFSFLVISFPKGMPLPRSLKVAQDLSYKLLFLLTKTLGSSKADQSPWCLTHMGQWRAGQLALH